jgi:uncharacterized membrane protein (UPF0127 family)
MVNLGFGMIKMIPLFAGEAKFIVEISDTPQKRARGLMGRKFIPKDYGMLFLFEEEGPQAFWMKNTLVELDIIFLDRYKHILKIFSNVSPCRAEPCESYVCRDAVKYVLEIRGGRSAELEIKIGQEISFIIN